MILQNKNHKDKKKKKKKSIEIIDPSKKQWTDLFNIWQGPQPTNCILYYNNFIVYFSKVNNICYIIIERLLSLQTFILNFGDISYEVFQLQFFNS